MYSYLVSPVAIAIAKCFCVHNLYVNYTATNFEQKQEVFNGQSPNQKGKSPHVRYYELKFVTISQPGM